MNDLLLYKSKGLSPLLLRKLVENTFSLNYYKAIPKVINYVEDIIPRFSMGTFKSHFRMNATTFEITLTEVANCPEFIKRDECFGGREQIEIEKMFLLVIWTLATPKSYRSVADRFNVSKSSVFYSIRTVVRVILTHLCKKFIKWPKQDERRYIANYFEKYTLPNVIGSIDGCQVPIKKPERNGIFYFNRKKFYSVVLQGICSYNLQFTNVDIRWPGSVHDARVLRTSDFYPLAQELCAPDFYIIGDSAYPCKEWLITPFKNNGHLTEKQIYFNTVLSKTRVIIENAFALLKGRFRRLKYLDMKSIQDIVDTVVTCCVLHNICLMHNDTLEEYLQDERFDENIQVVEGLENENEGVDVRNVLVDYVWNNKD